MFNMWTSLDDGCSIDTRLELLQNVTCSMCGKNYPKV